MALFEQKKKWTEKKNQKSNRKKSKLSENKV